MLVTGITLEVNVYKAVPIGKAGEAYDYIQRQQGVPVTLNITIPQNIDGVIQLEIINKSYSKELSNNTEHQEESKKWQYIKKEAEIRNLDPDNFEKVEKALLDSFLTITTRQFLQHNKEFTAIFSFYEEKQMYIPIAKDMTNVRT